MQIICIKNDHLNKKEKFYQLLLLSFKIKMFTKELAYGETYSVGR